VPPDAADLDLTYVLSRYPQAISTFVNGEIAAAARLGPRVAVCATLRTDEPDLRPGGIGAEVDVRWLPVRGEGRFWRGLARGLVRHPRTALDALRWTASAASGPLGMARWARLAASAIAEADALPRHRGRVRHLHSHFATEGAVAAHTISRLTGVGRSVTVHGSADLFRRDNSHLARVLRDATFVVAVSEFHRREVLVRVDRLNPDRVVVIPVGVPVDDLVARRPEVGALPHDGPRRIVSVASLGPTKGMPVLVDAVGQLVRTGHDVRLTIVGDGPERPAVADRIVANGLEGRVELLGRLPVAEAHAAIAGADAFALACVITPTGAHDGIPTVLAEAMAMGVPTASTRVSGIPELVEDGITGRLADPGDAAGMAEALDDLLRDPVRATALATAGRARVRERHDGPTNARRLVDEILART
jgi:colanic acid/amylovoran biosynthesis glycosyltransferase